MGAKIYTPYERTEADKNCLTDKQEFADEAHEIINEYARRYNKEYPYGAGATEIIVRHMLYCESVGYCFTPEQWDYGIKTCMGIIPIDKEYEKGIGFYGQSK